MDNKQTEIPETVCNSKHLSALIIELNIAHRNFRSYPKEHPVIEASFNKVITLYNKLFTLGNFISIGIARDSLVVDDVILDKKNIVFKDFAKLLYEQGIGALILHPDLKAVELRNFNIILSLKREDLLKHGGISVVWEKSRISSISIKPIQYDLFSATEAESVSANNLQQTQKGLWEIFIRTLILGTPGNSKSSNDILNEDDTDPEILANQLNRLMETTTLETQITFIDALSKVEQQLEYSELKSSIVQSKSYEKLALFVNNLNPDLRRKFLSNCFEVKSLSGEVLAEEVLSRFSENTIISTQGDAKQNRLNLPPVVLSLIHKLSSQAIDRQNELTRKTQKTMKLIRKSEVSFVNMKQKILILNHISHYYSELPAPNRFQY